MDATLLDAVKNHGPATAIALAAFWLMRQMLAGFAAALVDQRQSFNDALLRQRTDFLQELKDIRNRCQYTQPPGPKLAAAWLLAILLVMPGCTAGQGGTLADFNVVTPIGSVQWKAWTVTPATAAPTTQPAVPIR